MLKTITDKREAIKYLVARKYPALVLARLHPSLNAGMRAGSDDVGPINRGRREGEATEYRRKLEALSSSELDALFVSECAQAEVERQVAAQREEDARFFNLPYANADFEHWSKAAHWTLEEAVALSLGKAPEVVNSGTIQKYLEVSPFAFRYSRLLDLAKRATIWQKLFDPVMPIMFFNWTKDNEIEFPEALGEKIIKRSGEFLDWKGLFEKLKLQYEEDFAAWRKTAQDQGDLLAKCNENIAILQSKLEESQAKLYAFAEAPAPAPEKRQSTREREGMLKVIYSMAIGGYGYNPSDRRSKVIPDILKDIELQGLSVSDDTLRRYIKAACDLFPEWQEGR
jgi:hypothetical protein